MRKAEFEKTLRDLPGLVADGFMSVHSPEYQIKRRRFRQGAIYLQETLDALDYLKRFQKSLVLTPWQRKNCTPENLQPLVAWHAGRSVHVGPILVAALYLGFKVERDDLNGCSCLNLFARQFEGELRDFRLRQVIKQAVGS